MINEYIEDIALSADNAYDSKDINKLKDIGLSISKKLESNSFTNLEKAILAYHGATAYNNFLQLKYKNQINYSNNDNNEEDYEYCYLLYRRSLDFFDLITIDNNSEKNTLLDNYRLMALVNFSNLLNQTGRIIKSLKYLKKASRFGFPMALGNLASHTIQYAKSNSFSKHSDKMYTESYLLLINILNNPHKSIHQSAFNYFYNLKKEIEHILKGHHVQVDCNKIKEDLIETEYHRWCRSNALFLNPFNDINKDIYANWDTIHLPQMIISLKNEKQMKYHGIFNQIKQEFVSNRFNIYQCLYENEVNHYSDKNVYLVNTLDYPVYGLSVERLKSSFKELYSLFDRIAFFINHYFNIGLKDQNVSFGKIWEKKTRTGENLKTIITNKNSFNYGMVGLYWMFKDLRAIKVKYNHIDLKMKKIVDIRNALEHRYLKILDGNTFLINKSSNQYDELAYNISFDEFKEITLDLLNFIREAILLLLLGIEQVELRKKDDFKDEVIIPVYTDSYKDDWKGI